jgi:hypothetical protein
LSSPVVSGRVADLLANRESAAQTTRHPSIHKSWHKNSSKSGGRSVGIVRLRTNGHGVYFFVCCDSFLLPEYEANLLLYVQFERADEGNVTQEASLWLPEEANFVVDTRGGHSLPSDECRTSPD